MLSLSVPSLFLIFSPISLFLSLIFLLSFTEASLSGEWEEPFAGSSLSNCCHFRSTFPRSYCYPVGNAMIDTWIDGFPPIPDPRFLTPSHQSNSVQNDIDETERCGSIFAICIFRRELQIRAPLPLLLRQPRSCVFARAKSQSSPGRQVVFFFLFFFTRIITHGGCRIRVSPTNTRL